jgi:hypothetical protein
MLMKTKEREKQQSVETELRAACQGRRWEIQNARCHTKTPLRGYPQKFLKTKRRELQSRIFAHQIAAAVACTGIERPAINLGRAFWLLTPASPSPISKENLRPRSRASRSPNNRVLGNEAFDLAHGSFVCSVVAPLVEWPVLPGRIDIDHRVALSTHSEARFIRRLTHSSP